MDQGYPHEFHIHFNSEFKGVIFDGDKGIRDQVHCRCTKADLVALGLEHLIRRTSDLWGAVTKRGVDAAHNNFVRPTNPLEASPVHFHGNGNIIQTGNGNVATLHQSFGPDVREVRDLIEACRKSIDSLDAGEQDHTKEALDDLETEITSGSPKKSKVLSFLASATKHARAGTVAAQAFERLASALHLDPAIIEGIVHQLH